jgi:hypothetical protein
MLGYFAFLKTKHKSQKLKRCTLSFDVFDCRDDFSDLLPGIA